MRRNSITVNESGNIIMPENVSNIWMSEPELVELFGVIAPTLRSAIRNIYNSGALKEYEVQKYVRQENGSRSGARATSRRHRSTSGRQRTGDLRRPSPELLLRSVTAHR